MNRPAPSGRGPWVVLDLEATGGIVELVLANVGDEPAYDVVTTFETPLPGPDGEDLAALRLFRRLPLLRAGHERRVLLGSAPTAKGSAPAAKAPCDGRIIATVCYRGRDGGSAGERFEHDLAIFRDWPRR